LIHVKATAATDLAAALEKCRQAVDRHALSEELHYLHGVLLVDAYRSLEALQSLQKAIFLNRSSIMAHFLFGSIQRQQGQLESAGRHFRNVCRLCASQPPGRALPLASGETVADIAIAAESQLAAIEAMETES
jgi:chemotaxis protein methyltransferase CheR